MNAKHLFRRLAMLTVCMAAALIFSAPAAAGEQILSVNIGSGNDVWFISGEPSLVMNGFDLNALGIGLPATIDRVSLGVNAPVPGTPIDVVIYQDANGGSPVDAALAGRAQVDITSAGTFTVTLPTPVTVTQPAVWIGFYLPVDFRFLADTSGPSVLTYWAWTPGGTFDLANLASAQVLGPADGSAPVNINLNGRARITAEITGSSTTGVGTVTGNTAGDASANLSNLQEYVFCVGVFHDTGDEFVSLEDRVNMHCREVPSWHSTSVPSGYFRQGALYDIVIFKQNGVVAAGRLDVAITHCIRPAPEHLATAVIGNGYGSPRTWRILPTQRFGDLICAEVRHGGHLSYFTPLG